MQLHSRQKVSSGTDGSSLNSRNLISGRIRGKSSNKFANDSVNENAVFTKRGLRCHGARAGAPPGSQSRATDAGPRSPDVSKPDTKDLLKRMRKSIRTSRSVIGSALVNSMDGSDQPNPLAGEFMTVLKQRRLISDIPSNPGSRSEFVETTATTILSF